MGGVLSDELLRQRLQQLGATHEQAAFEEYAYSGRCEAEWVLDNFPEKSKAVAPVALHTCPEKTLNLLLNSALVTRNERSSQGWSTRTELIKREHMTIARRLHRIVATRPFPLLFATISRRCLQALAGRGGAHLNGFPLLAMLWIAVMALAGCSAESPSRGADRRDAVANVTATKTTVTNAQFALPKPSSYRPVTAAMEIVPADVQKGGIAEIQVRLEIAGAHYIYATNVVGKPFIPVSLNVNLPDGIEFSGGWVAPAPDRTKTGELVYTDSVSFRRSLRVGSNVPAGPVSIRGELRYQACTEELCWPPQTITLSSSINVSAQ
jgi:hypothetical protein